MFCTKYGASMDPTRKKPEFDLTEAWLVANGY
jgi:hypothetical protein